MSTPFVAETLLPTGTGFFRVRAYRHMEVETEQIIMEPLAIISGEVEGMEEVPIRVHDACFTSEVLGSLKCDCNEQLNMALEYMQENGPGLVIYLQQEGRGVGLANKIAAYAMQEKGLDTVDANRALGLPDDCREYTAVANILSELNVKSIRLMTNNPRKINLLTALGIEISGRIPSIAPSNQYNEGYLDAKEKRMDHLLDGQFRQNHQDVQRQGFSPIQLVLVAGGCKHRRADLAVTDSVNNERRVDGGRSAEQSVGPAMAALPVGTLVEVYWPGERSWYGGRLGGGASVEGATVIEYLDGNPEREEVFLEDRPRDPGDHDGFLSRRGGARLVALLKDDLGVNVRPIACGEVLRKLVAKVICRQRAKALRARFCGRRQDDDHGGLRAAQIGVAVKGGADLGVHTVQAALDRHPEWVCVKADARNAFNAVHREAMFEAIEWDFPEL
ncbi:hypothetical protein CYMTET_15049, partial [Cymbomonas tetramitiformis]